MLAAATFASIQARIDASNRESAANPSRYLLQEQASLVEIYERIPCPCGTGCRCRALGCETHWKLREDVPFDAFLPAFLRMFVPRKHLSVVLRHLRDGSPAGGRARHVVRLLQATQDDWPSLHGHASRWTRTVVCDDWRDDALRDGWARYHSSVYWAKLWAMLYPDTAVSYDTASRRLIRADTGGAPPSYEAMLAGFSRGVVALLAREGRSLEDFRRLDAPLRSGLAFDSTQVALPRAGFSYGTDYAPAERPLSRILDKLYYVP